MACDFLNKSVIVSNQSNNSDGERNWENCFRGLDEYGSSEELAHIHMFLNYPDVILKFAAACCCVFMLVGIPGNLVTIVALARYHKIRNATAIFIINLSIADLLYSIIIFPIAITLFLNQSWTVGKTMCWVFPIFNYGLTATSLYSIAAITINRYVLVLHPDEYLRIYQTRNLKIMTVCIWVGAFGMLIPIMFEWWGRFSLDPLVSTCTIIDDARGRSPKMLLVVMGFVFPMSLIIACYGRIMYVVHKTTARSNKNPVSHVQPASTGTKEDSTSTAQEDDTSTNKDGNKTSSSAALTKIKKGFQSTFRSAKRRLHYPTRKDKRLRSMIVAITLSFFVCHLPIMIINTAHLKGPYGNITGYLLLHVTVCVNPIIYVVMSKEYRQAYKSVNYWCSEKVKKAFHCERGGAAEP